MAVWYNYCGVEVVVELVIVVCESSSKILSGHIYIDNKILKLGGDNVVVDIHS